MVATLLFLGLTLALLATLTLALVVALVTTKHDKPGKNGSRKHSNNHRSQFNLLTNPIHSHRSINRWLVRTRRRQRTTLANQNHPCVESVFNNFPFVRFDFQLLSHSPLFQIKPVEQTHNSDSPRIRPSQWSLATTRASNSRRLRGHGGTREREREQGTRVDEMGVLEKGHGLGGEGNHVDCVAYSEAEQDDDDDDDGQTLVGGEGERGRAH